MEGYLLAVEPEPIPAEIRHGANVMAKLTIFDQFDEPHCSDLVLWVDRSAEWGPKPAVREPRRRLFELSDKQIGHRPRDAKILAGHGDLFELTSLGK